MAPSTPMRRASIDHMLRAAGEATGQKRFVLVGSAAVVAWFQTVPPSMAMTTEVDLFAPDADDPEEISFELDALLGRLSDFHEAHGYFVDGVSPQTARLPADWQERAIEYENPSTNGVVALVPAPEDIAVAKLVRCDDRDLDFIVAGVRHGLMDINLIETRAAGLQIDDLQQGAMSDKLVILRGRLTA
jgi:hypothetical protein